MKKFLFVLILFSCTPGQHSPEQPVTVQIIPSQGGFEIYQAGELVLEFTPENTDSASLETLRYLYEVAREETPRWDPGDAPKSEAASLGRARSADHPPKPIRYIPF